MQQIKSARAHCAVSSWIDTGRRNYHVAMSSLQHRQPHPSATVYLSHPATRWVAVAARLCDGVGLALMPRMRRMGTSMQQGDVASCCNNLRAPGLLAMSFTALHRHSVITQQFRLQQHISRLSDGRLREKVGISTSRRIWRCVLPSYRTASHCQHKNQSIHAGILDERW